MLNSQAFLIFRASKRKFNFPALDTSLTSYNNFVIKMYGCSAYCLTFCAFAIKVFYVYNDESWSNNEEFFYKKEMKYKILIQNIMLHQDKNARGIDGMLHLLFAPSDVDNITLII